MQALNFPQFKFKVKTENGKEYIFDVCRKKYVRLLPEEWVRQHLIHYLVFVKKYPVGLTKIEQMLTVNNRKKFTDISIYNNLGLPHLIAECKSFKQKLVQDNFNQAAHYNSVLGVKLFVVSNGLQHFVCEFKDEQIVFLDDVPEYKAE